MAGRTTHLPYEVEALLRKDLLQAHKHVDDVLMVGKPNRRVLVPSFLHPQLDAEEVPKTDEAGELHHYKVVRSLLEYIFEHDGRIKVKYRRLLEQVQVPPYIKALMVEEVEMNRTET